MTGPALLLAALILAPSAAAPATLAGPAAPLPSPYEACVAWVETLNTCKGADVDPFEGCAFAERLEDQTTAALYACWTDAVQANACDMEATGACSVLTQPAPDDPAAERAALEKDRTLNWCTRAVEQLERYGRHHGLTRTDDPPLYRCKAAVDAGNRDLVRRALASRSVPPPVPRAQCVRACRRYYATYNACAAEAGWTPAAPDTVAQTCDVADTCGQYDYIGYYGCLSEALPDQCADASSPLGSVYRCRLEG